MSSSRLAIASPHRLLRRGLRLICQREGRFQVVGEAEDGNTIIRVAHRLRPDAILIDVDLPGSGIDQPIGRVMEVSQASKVVVMARTPDDYRLRQGLDAGAQAVLSHEMDEAEFVSTICSVCENATPTTCEPPSAHSPTASDETSSHQSSRFSDPDEMTLTRGEMDVLILVGQGLSNKDISEELAISERAVANRLRQVFQKLDVANRTQAALVALRRGWAELSDNAPLETTPDRE